MPLVGRPVLRTQDVRDPPEMEVDDDYCVPHEEKGLQFKVFKISLSVLIDTAKVAISVHNVAKLVLSKPKCFFSYLKLHSPTSKLYFYTFLHIPSTLITILKFTFAK